MVHDLELTIAFSVLNGSLTVEGLAFLSSGLDDAQAAVALIADLTAVVANILEFVGATLLRRSRRCRCPRSS